MNVYCAVLIKHQKSLDWHDVFCNPSILLLYVPMQYTLLQNIIGLLVKLQSVAEKAIVVMHLHVSEPSAHEIFQTSICC